MTSYPPPPPPGDPQDSSGGHYPPQDQPGGYYPPPDQQGSHAPPPGQGGGYPPQGQGGGYYPPQGQGGYYQQPQKRGSGMAITALILGSIAVLSCWTIIGGILFGLVAIVLGFIASRRAKRGEAGGRAMAITGIVLGLLGLAISVVIVAVIGAFWNNASFADYRQCLSDAGSDQAAIADCEREFRDVIEDQANN
jgi:hypothetical protein